MCPNASWSRALEPAGLLSVKLFGARGDGQHDDADAVRRALNASVCCGGCVFFPPGQYRLGSTVRISGCVKGSAGTSASGGITGSTPPNVLITGASPPIAVVDDDDGVLLQDVAVRAATLAILIKGAAIVRFVNVAAQALADGDGVDTSVGGCNATGCNVVLGSMNAAMVVENSFWLWSVAQTTPIPGQWPLWQFPCWTQQGLSIVDS